MERKEVGMPGDLESLDSSSEDSSGGDDGPSSSHDDEDYFSDSHGEEEDEDEDESVSATETTRDETKEINNMLRKESKDVRMWREIVTGMLVITASLVTIATYIVLSREEVDAFNNGYEEIAILVTTTARFQILTLTESLKSMGDIMTTYALVSSSIGAFPVWPYVTLPTLDFVRHGEHVHTLTYTGALWASPVATNRTRWEEYALKVNASEGVPMNSKIFAYGEVLQSELDGFAMGKVAVEGQGPYIPIHQIYPSPPPFIPSVQGSMANYDMGSEPGLNTTYGSVGTLQHSVLSGLLEMNLFRDAYPATLDKTEPLSLLVQPVFRSFDDMTVVSYVQSIFEWEYLFSDILIEGQTVYCVVVNTCGQNFTYKIDGSQAVFEGMGDAHAKQYNELVVNTTISPYKSNEEAEAAGACVYTLSVYPSAELRESYSSNKPTIYTAVIGLVFFLMAATFFAYDSYVKRRNDKVIQAAARSNAIVSSLFPSNIRDRLYKDEDRKLKDNKWSAPKTGLKSYLRDDSDLNGNEGLTNDSKPLADLFPETTIMFADIVGFTAWSSVREPSQVFVLLETLYSGFDLVARRRRIFKVETIGDCYVAVAGLPEPRKDHAVAMAKFASDVLRKAHDLTRKLETTLGPDTGDLTMRIGLHSGPVTAGVLRGERSRFQLFGDTMNTAARMEHNGMRDRIQLSQETADLLIAAGKCHWLEAREDKIYAKGKGELTTYWLEMKGNSKGGSSRSSDSGTESNDGGEDTARKAALESGMPSRQFNDKIERLIDWNVDVLLRLLQQIIARRDVTEKEIDDAAQTEATKPFDEVKEIIPLPEFKESRTHRDPMDVKIPDAVADQLRDYVSNIAMLYNDNPFHNFEHASHVTMSVTKLLSRIVAPSDVLDDYRDRARKDLVSTLHDHTYGITSDPLTQFACVFSALIHDADHSGAPNTQLVIENSELARRYDGKSVAEQNSIDLAWSLLLQPQYKSLRRVICGTTVEFARFRQLVVNTVMATDIMDKELKMLRNMRWTNAFSERVNVNDSIRDQVNRKATIVIEHLIQASDVSHTMQHWHIYRKWNERFFIECYEAYRSGRAQTDPSVGWYQGELGFFDFYIIPLAKKLKECGVFGVSSDEYLQYAMKNRKEWEQRGQEVVAEMMQKVKSEQE